MNDIEIKLEKLKKKKWTYAAIADRLTTSPNTVQRWAYGEYYPKLSGAIKISLDFLMTEAPPKMKRYKYNEVDSAD